MRRLAALALVLAATGAAPAAADPVDDAPVVVPVNGGEVATAFATRAGARYDVVVRGVYAHGGTALGDCGHRNPGSAGTTFVAEANFFVDGGVAPCASMPAATEHVYRFTVTGTGGPVRFRLTGPAGSAGALQVSVARHVVTADCHFSVSGLPSSRNVLVTVQAEAVAEGASDVGMTGVRCEVSNAYGEKVVADFLAPGARAVVVAEGVLRASTLRTCVQASATWVTDLATAAYGPVCH